MSAALPAELTAPEEGRHCTRFPFAWSTPACTVARRGDDAGRGETGAADAAGIAAPARAAGIVRLIARHRESVIDAEACARRDDLRLAHLDERRAHGEVRALHTGLGRETRERLEGRDEGRPTIGIARVIDRLRADEDVACAQHLGPRKRQRQEHGVARIAVPEHESEGIPVTYVPARN